MATSKTQKSTAPGSVDSPSVKDPATTTTASDAPAEAPAATAAPDAPAEMLPATEADASTLADEAPAAAAETPVKEVEAKAVGLLDEVKAATSAAVNGASPATHGLLSALETRLGELHAFLGHIEATAEADVKALAAKIRAIL